jgi:hypothetical protein
MQLVFDFVICYSITAILMRIVMLRPAQSEVIPTSGIHLYCVRHVVDTTRGAHHTLNIEQTQSQRHIQEDKMKQISKHEN